MKGNYEIFKMLKIMAFLDITIGLALSMLVGIININYLIISILGFFMAVISFYLNAYLTNITIAKKKDNSKGIIVLSFILRIIIIGAIGLLLFTHNKFSVLAYIGGYSFRFFTLLIYGLIIKNN